MPTNVIMPQMGESVAEGTIIRWLKRVGDHVERDEPLFEITTDKVDAEIPSPAAGILTTVLVGENETVTVNTVVAVIDGESPAVAPSLPERPQVQKTAPPAAVAPATGPLPAHPGPSESPEVGIPERRRTSPLVRRIAREHQVDLACISGSGLGGRVTKKDILSYLAQRQIPEAPPRPVPTADQAATTPEVPKLIFTGPTLAVPMTPMRRQIAEHMVASKRTSAHVTTVFEVEMTRVVETRERHGAEFERRNGMKLTYTPFFVRAAVNAIKEFLVFNSSLDGTNVVYKRDVNIGVAVALETGLIVPVVRHADEKNFLGLARAIQELAERARTKRLSVDDVQGGTFTITNPGSFGSLFGTPIINQPQVAILGVGVIEKRAVVRNDAIAIRPMVYLALSYDHRVIDGAVADQFMARLKGTLENWEEPVV